jgi:hypothetical protein
MLSALIVASLLAAEAEPSPAGQAIVADLGLHVLGVGYHRQFSNRVIGAVSVDLYVPWTYTQNILGLSGSYRSDLAGVVVRGRAYFILVAGLWVSPFIQGGPARASVDSGTAWGGVGAFGATIGYAGTLFEHLLISGGLGVQLHAAWMGATSPPSFLGAWPAVDLVIGYTW